MTSIAPFLVERLNHQFEFSQILPTVLAEIEAALLSGRYILSEEVERFERAFAAYIGCDHAIGVNSGTDALCLALEALGIGSGDEVITAANTFHATALAIARTGAKPVLVDARISDFQMDTAQVESSISPSTKAILPVHIFGLAMDLSPLKEICKRHNLYLVEDCAQATGASIGGRRVGSLGDIGCFSFHPSKTLGAAGDAGALTTNSLAIATRVRSLRYFGQRERKIHSELGHNSKLDSLQAIVLFGKLPLVDNWNHLRRRQAHLFIGGLANLPLKFQATGQDEEHVYHLFQVRVAEASRNALLFHLVSHGIDAVVRYPTPIHLQPAFRYLGHGRGAFPVAEQLAESNLCLPLRPDMSVKETALVLSSVRQFFFQCGEH